MHYLIFKKSSKRKSPYNYSCRAHDIAAVGSIFNVFGYEAALCRDATMNGCPMYYATVVGFISMF